MNRLRERDREWHELSQGPGTERRMENWKREVGRELSILRGQITATMSLGNLEERCDGDGALLTELVKIRLHVSAVLRGKKKSLRHRAATSDGFCFLSHSFGSKLCREELEHLRSDVSQLKTLLSEPHAPSDAEIVA